MAQANSQITRRTIIAAAGSVPAAVLFAAPAVAAEGDDAKLLELERQWLAISAELQAEYAHNFALLDAGDRDAVERNELVTDALWLRRHEVEVVIRETPAQGPAGLAVKAAVLRYWIIMDASDDKHNVDLDALDNDDRLALELVDGVMRMAGRAPA
jgi:hypothetical protein